MTFKCQCPPTPAGHGLTQGLHDGVGELVARAEARNRWGRKFGVGQAAFGGDNRDRPGQPVVHRDVAMHGSIQQHGADGQPDGDVDRAFQGHIDRAVAHLVCRPVRSTVIASPATVTVA